MRIAAGQTAEAIAGIERAFKKFNADRAFEFSFQDEQFESMYRTESTMGTLATFFAIFAIFISCLGLFGWRPIPRNNALRKSALEKFSVRLFPISSFCFPKSSSGWLSSPLRWPRRWPITL